jgi:hypothetical protein
MAAVPAGEFRLLAGENSLTDYQFAKKRVHHLFCTRCGVRPFSRGSDGKGIDSYAVKLNCLDNVDPQELVDAPVKYFDMLHDDFKTPPRETRHL